jgi:DNA-binding GntR family transcriptional regulator
MRGGVKVGGDAIETLPLNEQIAARLRDDVLSGRLPAEQRLAQQELAVRFQVSRIPVRDALRMLEAEGLVTYHPRLGATVAALTVEDLDELYEMRIALEPANARRAVRALVPADDTALAEHLSAMRAAADNARAWFQAHADFHRVLNERSGQGRINALLDNLRRQTERYVRFFQMVEVDSNGLLSEHDRIRVAAGERDAAGVETAIRDHLRMVRDKVVGHLGPHDHSAARD